MLEDVGARLPHHGVPEPVAAAQGRARVVGGGLDHDLVEDPFEQDPAVHHRVEADAAGQADLVEPGRLGGASGPGAGRPPRCALQGGGDVLVVLGQLALGVARRAEGVGGTSG